MGEAVTIESGFAEVGAGSWLVSRGQPAAFLGSAVRRPRRGWFVRDRSALDLVETTGRTFCADAARPFLTLIPCAAAIFAVSCKVLLAAAAARTASEIVKIVPLSMRGAICATVFGGEKSTASTPDAGFVVMATASRTKRVSVEDGDTLSVRPESVVAWTGNRPTGFVRRLRIWDVLLPRAPRDMVLHFHGPCVVWLEGRGSLASQLSKLTNLNRRYYGV